ncbi:hypothetical protein HK097_009897 [Rhizophlyctis rosea]|uniref:Uncharacterized protein n=1 Tax=Rhizophlyctis rosea TaxID=64517 RepID=A0AAD5SB30_9FUNG|nr:hypothetical protein HK097_009897 [Rhizophlyctis rosea]
MSTTATITATATTGSPSKKSRKTEYKSTEFVDRRDDSSNPPAASATPTPPPEQQPQAQTKQRMIPPHPLAAALRRPLANGQTHEQWVQTLLKEHAESLSFLSYLASPPSAPVGRVTWLHNITQSYAGVMHADTTEYLNYLQPPKLGDQTDFYKVLNIDPNSTNQEIEMRMLKLNTWFGWFGVGDTQAQYFVDAGYLRFKDKDGYFLDREGRKMQDEREAAMMEDEYFSGDARNYAKRFARLLRETCLAFDTDFSCLSNVAMHADDKQLSAVDRAKKATEDEMNVLNATHSAIILAQLRKHRSYLHLSKEEWTEFIKGQKNGKDIREKFKRWEELYKLLGAYVFFIDCYTFVQQIGDDRRKMLGAWWNDDNRRKIPMEKYEKELTAYVERFMHFEPTGEQEQQLPKKRTYDQMMVDTQM